MKTFVYIGAARRFANSVEMPLTKLSFKGVDGFEVGPPLSQPLGQTRLDGRGGQASNLNKGIQVIEFPLYYLQVCRGLVVASKETAEIAAGHGAQRISFPSVMSVFRRGQFMP